MEITTPETVTESLPPSDAPENSCAEETSPVVTEIPKAPEAVTFAQMETLYGQLSQQVGALEKRFDERIMYVEHEKKNVDLLHKELQKYKEDLYAQLIRPVLLDVISVRDSIFRRVATCKGNGESEPMIPLKTLDDYVYDLQDVLEQYNVDVYQSKSGDEFQAMKQRIVQKVSTTEESLHGKVAESMSCGYLYNQKVLSAEKVSVYYLEKPVEVLEKTIEEENHHG